MVGAVDILSLSARIEFNDIPIFIVEVEFPTVPRGSVCDKGSG